MAQVSYPFYDSITTYKLSDSILIDAKLTYQSIRVFQATKIPKDELTNFLMETIFAADIKNLYILIGEGIFTTKQINNFFYINYLKEMCNTRNSAILTRHQMIHFLENIDNIKEEYKFTKKMLC